MLVLQKSQYALRAIYGLARHYGQGWQKISHVAREQAIPPRFLEVILSQLKQGGIVTSRRGTQGGYALIRHPRHLTVGEVLRLVQGPVTPVHCMGTETDGNARESCPLKGDCVFMPLWQEVQRAVGQIYDGTTFQDLLDLERRKSAEYVAAYVI